MTNNQQAAREWLVTLRDEAQSLLDYASKHLDHMADTQQTAAYDWWIGRRDTLVELLEKIDQPRWLPIESAPKGVAVLIHYKNQLGKSRVIKARYIERFTEEAGHDCEEGVDEYDEANDRFTYTQGWWEMIDNWDDFAFVAVHEGQPDMWQPLPAPPRPTQERSDERS